MKRFSAGNNFSSLKGHVSFQIFILVEHLINLPGHTNRSKLHLNLIYLSLMMII